MILGFVLSYCLFELFIVGFVKSKFALHFQTQNWKEYNNFIPKNKKLKKKIKVKDYRYLIDRMDFEKLKAFVA